MQWCVTRPLVIGLLLVGGAAGVSANSGSGWDGQALGQLGRAEYRFAPTESGAWSAPNRAQGLRSVVNAEGLRVDPRSPGATSWSLELKLTGVGRGRDLEAPGAAVIAVDADGRRLELRRSTLTEWYENGPRGLEQGFTLATRPGGPAREDLVLQLRATGNLSAQPRGEREIRFLEPGGERAVLRYAELHVVDARGRVLPSHLETNGTVVNIVVDDHGASYPVTVDPLVTNPDWSALGAQAGAHFGTSVRGAGDVNCDGFADIVVGAPDYDAGELDEGAVFVYHGSSSGPSTTPSWSAQGNHAGGQFGWAVASAGDVNNDLCDDLIVGAPLWDTVTQFNEGVAFVFYGSGSGLGPSGTPANADWRAEGDQISANFGSSVASAGDVNNDGFDDIIVGADRYDAGQTDEGAAFVFQGSSNGLALVGNTRPVGNPTNAVWTGQSNQVSARYGLSVSSAGDVTGDGRDEVIVGAPFFENNFNNEGRVFMYLGAAAPTYVNAAAIWVLDGGQDDADLGVSLNSAGDVNGDLRDDVIVGADAATDGQVFEGAALLFYGVPSGLLSTTPAWKGQVDQGDAFFGFSVAGVGDVNGDGFDDVLVGADGWDNGEIGEGGAFLYYGSPDGLSVTAARSYEIDLDGAEFGTSVEGAGDVDGDGYADLLIGADLLTQGPTEEGAAFVYLGCDDSDRDGTCQVDDNCPLLANADQEDTDGDGMGDVCDPCQDVDVDAVCDEPRVLIEGSGPGEQVLIEYASGMRYRANAFGADPGIGLAWTQQVYPQELLAPWALGQYGVGYDDDGSALNLLLTLVPAGRISVYTRSHFPIQDKTKIQSLYIGADYDDAYVAWINGVEVYRSPEMPAGTPLYNTTPNPSHEASNGLVPNYGIPHDISATGIPALVDGDNVLAVGIWNAGSGSTDLVLVPRLSINRPKSATMKYQANSSAPSGGLIWTQLGFDDSAWISASYGVGFEAGTAADDLINVEVPATARSVYTRAEVNIDAATVDTVFVGADYDDAYVMWINGGEVYRSPEMPGAPGTEPPWNANPAQHESSNGLEPNYGTLQNVTAVAKPLLVTGSNIVAIGAWTTSPAGNDDLVLVPRVSVNETGVDNCLGVYNPTQADKDLDGAGDACDPDVDGDGFNNSADNCPFDSNASQTDSDGDGSGNACDVCPGDATDDADADGICSGSGYAAPKTGDADNCTAVFNPRSDCDANPITPPLQCDTDLDGLGDACDPDIDGDTKPNGADNCVYVANVAQTNTDGDPNGDACDCTPSNAASWQTASGSYNLRLSRRDSCADLTCTQSQQVCANDAGCVHDACTNKACTQSLGACGTNADCDVDECADFECTAGGNPCLNDAECVADVCANRHCTVGGNLCTSNTQCTADQCAGKQCIETGGVCNTHTDCPGGANDLCLGNCTAGGNICAANSACVLDVCGTGTCTAGLNSCTSNANCTADVCRGTCTVGGNACASSASCTAPQTDLCRGTCSLGANQCASDAACTVPQTDLCRGFCSIGGNNCADHTACVAAPADNVFWRAPLVPGGLTLVYDTLRTPDVTNFFTQAICVESNGTNRVTLDPALPGSPGTLLYYLVRVENGCPTGNMGQDSIGNPHTGKNCP